jgi:NAD(P)-dependent dehydrogenase (short-subunit alcohol dehydrogenase family)
MIEAGRGTIILTGATASLRGGAKFALLACPKFALRALSQCLAREFQPKVSLIWHPNCCSSKKCTWQPLLEA